MDTNIGYEGLQSLFGENYHVSGISQENVKTIILIQTCKTEDACRLANRLEIPINNREKI